MPIIGVPTVKGAWLCIDLMVKMNSPVSSFNGEQAFWVDGEKKNHLGPGFPNGLWSSFHPNAQVGLQRIYFNSVGAGAIQPVGLYLIVMKQNGKAISRKFMAVE
jgi:hypothetical protein